jgi:hypothetical protein
MGEEPTKAEYLLRLRLKVEQHIETYVYQFPSGMIGNPWSDARIKQGLEQFKRSLVEPYWEEVEIRDTFDQVSMAVAPRRQCAVVADDGEGMLLLFDPVEGSFVLAQREAHGLITFGVRGDAVGCFLAR